ncbi:sec-independent protein translocase protein TatB [Marinobacterium mangrovicola]|uniref:Sec-independent protein translocase protein TatB n=3 Tax=Marinobacterium TaxID=48075 RepID=A0A1H6DFE4_9GAMM|nr:MULTISPECIES: Sec-independent protein translocase protein TatB [Marinobacterium]TCK03532.1 sec-independent protein translocase protein TatB [Marinobacterium mangrovicola]SEG83999.1 sec-independent protein translocase protein TatB [Marinobacterium lutimaris]
MVDIGFTEMLLVAVVALLVLGPERLPVAARTCGLWLGRIRRMVGSIQQEINEELKVDELKQATAARKAQFKQEFDKARRPFAADAADDAATNTATARSADDLATASTSTQTSPNTGTL